MRSEPPRERRFSYELTSANLDHHISKIGGVSPIQAEGTIGASHHFYFRGRHSSWQFVAGPHEISLDALIDQMHFRQGYRVPDCQPDERIFLLQGDDEQERYYDDDGGTYDVAQGIIDVCVQQFRAWIRKRKS